MFSEATSAGLLALVSILMALYFPESPRFLLIKRRKRDLAEKSVHFYHGVDELQTAKVLTSYEKEAQEANGTIKEMLYKNMCGLDCCLAS